MPQSPAAFRFDYESPALRFGPDSVRDLDASLDAHDADTALVVTGSTVGTTPAVMDPVRDGLGDRLAGVFAETTGEKRLTTAFDAAERVAATDADAIVAVGGGSSIDVATVAAALTGTTQSRAAVARTVRDTATVPIPDGALPPIVVVPTTLAGADISQGAGIAAHPDAGVVDDTHSAVADDRRLMPASVVADPVLAATTPRSVLAGSAMNGLNKGIETLYAATATPITDATASHGVGMLAAGLRALGTADPTPETMAPILRGLLLVEYGISRPDATTLSLTHAFGHALSRASPIQQGVAHAVVTPHVLAHLFDSTDGRRDRLAAALDVGDDPDPASAVIDAVTAVRDALGLPARLRDTDGPARSELQAVAAAAVADPFVDNAPDGVPLTRADATEILDAAW